MMTKQTKVLTGLLAGVALGAVVALVITSKKDGKFKDKVSDWLCDLLEGSKDKFAKTMSKAKDEVTKMHS
jgi:gas vesicle protein